MNGEGIQMNGRKKLLWAVLAIFTISFAAPAFADSLWNEKGSLFTDRKASGIGDVVMVRVVENVKDSDEGKSKSSKTTEEGIDAGTGLLNFIDAITFGSVSGFNSDTKVERTKSLNTTVSCLVTDIMPNGNMVIEGDRYLTSGAEKMNVRFSGVIRPQDISHYNIVESTRVANAEIVVTGKGTVSRTQRAGIINQILSAIF